MKDIVPMGSAQPGEHVQAVATTKRGSASFAVADSAPATVSGAPPRAVVIDDDRAIRLLVSSTLRSAGYVVEEGETGASALRLAQTVPDVMVLDLHLPDLSGLAVCRAIRGGRVTADVPIVFLTATDDAAVITSGFVAGASDYIVKPFVGELLAVRVNRVARARLAVLERIRRVEELDAATLALNETRATLAGGHRLSGLGILVGGVATEMNIPLAAITSRLAMASHNKDPDAGRTALVAALASAEILSGLVRRLRGIAGTDDRARTEINLRARCELVAKGFVKVPMVFQGDDVVVSVVDAEIREALIALFDNASRAAQGNAHPRVEVTTIDEGPIGAIVIDDNGAGIPEEDVPWLSTPFFAHGQSTRRGGVGLSLVGAAMRRHGGSMEIVGHGPLGGARVTIRLPKIAVEVDVEAAPLMGL